MKTLAQRRDSLLRKLEQCSDLARGSINSVCSNCNRARCICEKKRSKKTYRLTYKDSQQKTRIVYIPRSGLKRIKKMIANYAKLRKILEQLIETNLEIFKKEAKR